MLLAVVPQYRPMAPTLVREPFDLPGWKHIWNSKAA
jgi:hypothetical protein